MSDWITEQIKKAWSCNKQGDIDGAIRILNCATKQEPGDGFLWVLLGNMQLEKGLTKDAELSARIALSKPGGLPNAYRVLGRSLRMQAQNLEAVEAFKCATKLDPCVLTFIYLADAQRVCENLVEAEAALREVLRIDPENEEAFLQLAMLCTKEEDEKAVAYLEKVISLDPDCADAYLEMGQRLLSLQLLEEAAASLRKAISLASDDVWCYMYLGLVLQEMGLIDDAEKELRKAVEIDPDHSAAQMVLANFYKGRNRNDEAEVHYRLSIDAWPDDSVALRCFANFLFSQDRTEEAKVYAEKAISIDPDDGKTRRLLKDIMEERI